MSTSLQSHALGQPATTVFQNGQWLSHDQGGYAVEDRGVLFADGLYEVIRYDGGRGFRVSDHMRRLGDGLEALGFPAVDLEQLVKDMDALIEHNALVDARVYIQITRGSATRDFVIRRDLSPSVTMLAFSMPPLSRDATLETGAAIIVEDQRWMRCNLKTTMLMPASMAKTRAVERGAQEAIFLRHKPGVDEKHITEGASTNVFAVIEGKLWTHPLDQWVLPGVTRRVVLEAAAARGLEVIEEAMTLEQMLAADEVFVCSTTHFTAITQVEDTTLGSAVAGEVTRALHRGVVDMMLEASR